MSTAAFTAYFREYLDQLHQEILQYPENQAQLLNLFGQLSLTSAVKKTVT
ncbi:MAG: hypothetical protein R2828_20655 [Saprospiraceae bacterium]